MDKRMSDEVRRTGVIASGIAMLAMLLAGGCGSSADTTDMAQAGRMPAPAEVAGSAVANELPGSAGTGQEGGAEQAVSLEADTSTIPI
ncbi:MAG: hypothetical protein R3F46_01325 [bacterium]